jgi:hypothetical protein
MHRHHSVASLVPLTSGRPSPYGDVPDVPPLPRKWHSDVSPKFSTSFRLSSSGSGSSTFLDWIRGRRGHVLSRMSMEDEPKPRKETRHEGGNVLSHQMAVVLQPRTGVLNC